jgi:hypothetical protein
MSLAVRGLGWLLLLAAFAIMGRELYLLADTGKMKLLSWGDFWYSLHPASLNLYQAVVERYVSPTLWDKVLAPMLLWDAFTVFAVPGAALVALPRLVRIVMRRSADLRHD